jgi:hypothetical protein
MGSERSNSASKCFPFLSERERGKINGSEEGRKLFFFYLFLSLFFSIFLSEIPHQKNNPFYLCNWRNKRRPEEEAWFLYRHRTQKRQERSVVVLVVVNEGGGREGGGESKREC